MAMSRAKQIVKEELNGVYSGKLSVTRGHGTAHSWIYVKTERDVQIPADVKTRIAERLEDEGIIGRFYTDYGYGNSWLPNLSWMSL